MWGMGFGPGKPVFPRMYAPIPKVSGAFDTSGSVDEHALLVAMSEWASIIRELNLPMAMYACDCQVHAAVKVRSVTDALKALKGGGGTDFRPIFEAIKKAGRNEQPDVLAIFTDGDGPAPKVNPLPRTKILWVVIESSWGSVVPYDEDGNEVTYGEVIHIPRNERRSNAA